MRIAYLILAHRQPLQVARLVQADRRPGSGRRDLFHPRRQEDPRHHLPANSERSGWSSERLLHTAACLPLGRIRAGAGRTGGHRGDVRAPVPAGYIVLLSGQDYPIKTNDHIHEFFERSAGCSYLDYDTVPSPVWTQAAPRIDSWQGDLRGGRCCWGGRRSRLDVDGRSWQLVLPAPPPAIPAGLLRPFTGSVYWALTREATQLVDDVSTANRSLVRFFRFTCCPDELFFRPCC